MLTMDTRCLTQAMVFLEYRSVTPHLPSGLHANHSTKCNTVYPGCHGKRGIFPAAATEKHTKSHSYRFSISCIET